MAVFLQILINGVLISPFLTALGVSIVYGTARVFHITQGVVAIAAGYAYWWGYSVQQWHPVLAAGLALLAAVAISLAMNELVYEQLRARRTKGLGYLIAALGLITLFTGIFIALFGSAPKTNPLPSKLIQVGGIYFTSAQVWDILTVIILVSAAVLASKYTKLGKAMRATADNEEVAEIVGIDTKNIRRLAFVIAGVLAAAAGIILFVQYPIDPNAGAIFGVRGYTATVIGGVTRIPGTVIGSLILGLSEQGVVWFLGSGYRNAVTFFLLFVFLLLRPEGIFGASRKL